MRLHTPVETLAASVYHAAHAGLLDYSYETVDDAAVFRLTSQERQAAREREARGEKVLPRKVITTRPAISQCVVRAMFPQLWGSTALGFGGIGGQAMTDAYSVVVEGPSGELAVYWSGRFAYLVDPKTQTPEQRAAFEHDLQSGRTASRKDAANRYGVGATADAEDVET